MDTEGGGGHARRISSGVIVTDGSRILLGHACRSPRWDIPKGGLEAGETALQAAVRELHEETGLVVDGRVLVPLGFHQYLKNKESGSLPDPGSLHCTSLVVLPDGTAFPELDRFGLFEWKTAASLVGRNLARVLSEIRSLLPGGG